MNCSHDQLVEMKVEREFKEDGRLILFFRFDALATASQSVPKGPGESADETRGEKKSQPVDADV
jgi:hypothetical protein